MNIIIVGLNHKTAPVEVRERLAFSSEALGRALHEMRFCEGVAEAVILSTCNRVEVCAAVRNVQEGYKSLHRFLERFHRDSAAGSFESYLYFYEAQDAIRHVFRVASSLDSMVIGESQILGQIKEAYEAALARKTTGVVLNRLFHKAISVGKRVRTETQIAESPISVSSVAVELAVRIFGQIDQTSVLLIGSGEMAELAARALIGQGVHSITITGRNYARACEMAAALQGHAARFDSIFGELCRADIVICSTSATHYLITAEQMQAVIQLRKNRPIFLIDLSVPRNIEPESNRIDNVYLYDIDDLQLVVDANRKQREREAEKAEAIVAQEVEALSQWLKSLDVVPTIVALREFVEEVRRSEVQKALNRLGDGGPQAREALEAATNAIINKLLHGPLTMLKREANSPNGSLYLDAVRKLFNLDRELPARRPPPGPQAHPETRAGEVQGSGPLDPGLPDERVD